MTSDLSSLPYLVDLLPDSGEHTYSTYLSFEPEIGTVLNINLNFRDTDEILTSVNISVKDLLIVKAHYDETLSPKIQYVHPYGDTVTLGEELDESVQTVKDMFHDEFTMAIDLINHMFDQKEFHLEEYSPEEPSEEVYKPLSSY